MPIVNSTLTNCNAKCIGDLSEEYCGDLSGEFVSVFTNNSLFDFVLFFHWSITSFKFVYFKGINANGTRWFENFNPEFPDQHLNSNTEIPFDFESIMNYPDDWMSNGNGPTMVPKDPNVKFNITQNMLV